MSIIKDLQQSLLLATFLGWNVTELDMDFAKWLAENKIKKSNLEAYVKLALDEQLDISDPIEYNLTDDCLDLIYVVEEEIYKIWFDGFRFEDWVGSKDLAYDCHMKGSGQTVTVSASEWLKNNWKDEAYNFIINNWKYAEIEKL